MSDVGCIHISPFPLDQETSFTITRSFSPIADNYHMHRHSKSSAMSYLVIDTSESMYEPDTWSIAKVAHDKLVTEAGFRDHDLRKIVAHACLYDRLLEEVNSSKSSSPSSSPPSSPKLAFEPISEEKTITLEMKEEIHHGIIEEHAELDLVKVASHSDNMLMAEIAVEEVEVFDDD